MLVPARALLVKAGGLLYRQFMRNVWFMLSWLRANAGVADTLQLKGQGVIAGTAFAEKHDTVVANPDSTALMAPPVQLAKIIRNGDLLASFSSAP